MRRFNWVCPNCRTSLSVETEEDHDDEARGVDGCGNFGYTPRCPMCCSCMVDDDEIAVWYIGRNKIAPGTGFSLSTVIYDLWRQEQPKSAHDEQCEIYDREDAPCECGHDARMVETGGSAATATRETVQGGGGSNR